MGKPASKPRTRRKLNRSQVQDILERNVKLYKDEPTFIPYLIELAIYLLEYEYDWSESSALPPEHLLSPPDAMGSILDLEKQARGGEPSPPKKENTTGFSTPLPKPAKRECPFCGRAIGDQLQCPNCHNMTR